ncbi:2,3-bisphosphoglycerate-independent phosphoglycerate mutase [Geminocystis sp. NIES-3709]|uniref:2,3-bisphosphoglycerate-independent phosphoglycerate mutase n=1 Tax=Geminocystis sp. NIES-3709 TaxID=1617448 RepID=UPI0005FCC027|nr:2,3-bisphosphoglycerate-independent phosphoglycerate mutase [Geminocystis sp. NIES-3709]BAQ63855.1 2,3-bisphosphoglycerate-independent phosphoglycerate mutase [Geminocystis sp. NIES-3709]
MTQTPISPVVLVILDGWGYREDSQDNAIALAKTPVMDSLLEVYPNTLINASGRAVGLPNGQMGNSEVGHLNLGAGRVVPQELVRISDAVEDGSIFKDPVLEEICQNVIKSQGKLHLMGLCSDGGVHSHLDHLIGLLDLAKLQGVSEVCVHFITDGRDTNPNDAVKYVRTIEEHIKKIGVGKIVTICGRYYAMDRDRRWDRVQKAYDLYTIDGTGDGRTTIEVIEDSYKEGINDEFIEPTRIAEGAITEGDAVIFYNFRPDRARQICYAFTMDNFNGFERQKIENLHFATFTQYDPNLPVKVVFEPQYLTNILGEVIANAGLKQFRVSETEKYPHVTYFFNGGLEQPLEGEDRELVQSPMVATYDKAPAMSAMELTTVACDAITKGIYSLVVMNYANPDMVGHTGKLDAAQTAIETVDTCLGKLLKAINQVGGTVLITADHGNAEYMKDENGNPWTAHTTNQVPFILVEGEGRKIIGHGGNVKLKENGKLADIAPTILDILQLPKPQEMTGESLITKPEYEVKKSRTPISVAV